MRHHPCMRHHHRRPLARRTIPARSRARVFRLHSGLSQRGVASNLRGQRGRESMDSALDPEQLLLISRLASADACATTLEVIYLGLTQAFVEDLDLLPVNVDVPTSSAVVFTATRAVCRKHVLTAYENRLPGNRHPREARDGRWRFEAGCRGWRRADPLGGPGRWRCETAQW